MGHNVTDRGTTNTGEWFIFYLHGLTPVTWELTVDMTFGFTETGDLTGPPATGIHTPDPNLAVTVLEYEAGDKAPFFVHWVLMNYYLGAQTRGLREYLATLGPDLDKHGLHPTLEWYNTRILNLISLSDYRDLWNQYILTIDRFLDESPHEIVRDYGRYRMTAREPILSIHPPNIDFTDIEWEREFGEARPRGRVGPFPYTPRGLLNPENLVDAGFYTPPFWSEPGFLTIRLQVSGIPLGFTSSEQQDIEDDFDDLSDVPSGLDDFIPQRPIPMDLFRLGAYALTVPSQAPGGTGPVNRTFALTRGLLQNVFTGKRSKLSRA